MPFKKTGPDTYVSPSGKKFTYPTDGFDKSKIKKYRVKK